MELLFKKIKSAFPKAIAQYEKNYVSFTFGGGLYYQLRVQKDKVRMMATNYPNKAKIGECLKLIKKHSIEGQDVNGNEIIFEVGARNPEIFTLRIEMPYKSGQLEKDSFNKGVVDSCAKFHEILLPLVNKFLKEPVSDLYRLMGGKSVSLNQKAGNEKVAIKKTAKSIDKYRLNTLAKTDSKKTIVSKSKSIVDYKSVKIGKQVWMTENLNVERFRNGDLIPEAKSQKEWEKAGKTGKPAWCYYENKASNGKKYGKLYNWYAVNDPKGLAPEGWHIPSDEEWAILTEFLGGEDVAGTKMKNNLGWEDYLDEDEYSDKDKGNGTNESGFSALPGGNRISFPNFNGIGRYGCWWSSTEATTGVAWDRDLDYENSSLNRDDFSKEFGLSVRCIKD